jgi:hypothetical protein
MGNISINHWDVIKDYVGPVAGLSHNLDMSYTYKKIHNILNKAARVGLWKSRDRMATISSTGAVYLYLKSQTYLKSQID